MLKCKEDKSIYAVVVSETDRLARGNKAFIPIREAIKSCNVKVIAVTQPMLDDSDEGEMLGEIFGAINGFFSKLTHRKSMRALDEKAARGWYPSMAPIGYKNVNIGTEEQPQRIIEVNEEQAIYLRQIPKLYNLGYSYNEIADKLYNEGLRSNQGKKVSHNEIRKILFSDFYCGKFTWRGKNYQGKHSPLFSLHEVEKCRAKSQQKGHIHSTIEYRETFIFKKLDFYCGNCMTCRITGEKKIKRYKNRVAEYILYHCTKSQGGWKNCQEPTINVHDLVSEFATKAVEPIVIDEDLAEFLLEEMDQEYASKVEEQAKLLVAINKRLAQIDTELKNLFELRIKGKIQEFNGKTADEIYEEYLKEKELERSQLLLSREKIQQNNSEWKKKASNFFLMVNDAKNRFLEAKEVKQFEFLKATTSNLLLSNKKVIVEHKFPFSELITLNSILLGSPYRTRYRTDIRTSY